MEMKQGQDNNQQLQISIERIERVLGMKELALLNAAQIIDQQQQEIEELKQQKDNIEKEYEKLRTELIKTDKDKENIG